MSQVLAPITKLRRTVTSSDSPRKFRNRLLQAHDVIHVDEMQYRKWLNTDRSSLERIHQKVGEFVQSFSHCLTPLLAQDFEAKLRSKHLRDLKGKWSAAAWKGYYSG